MSTKRLRYSERVPWMPTALQLAHQIGRVNALYAHREARGDRWWSHLRAGYLSAGLPVDATLDGMTTAAIATARTTQGTMVGIIQRRRAPAEPRPRRRGAA